MKLMLGDQSTTLKRRTEEKNARALFDEAVRHTWPALGQYRIRPIFGEAQCDG